MATVDLACNARPVCKLSPGAELPIYVRVVAAPVGHPEIPKGHMYVWGLIQGDRVLCGESAESYTEACARAKLMLDTLLAVQDKKRHAPPEKGLIIA